MTARGHRAPLTDELKRVIVREAPRLGKTAAQERYHVNKITLRKIAAELGVTLPETIRVAAPRMAAGPKLRPVNLRTAPALTTGILATETPDCPPHFWLVEGKEMQCQKCLVTKETPEATVLVTRSEWGMG